LLMAAPFFQLARTMQRFAHREVTARKYATIGSLSAAGDRPLNP
jgi:hypothetical protein